MGRTKAKPPAGAPPPPPKIDLWPASHPGTRKVATLLPYANNARTHSPEQVQKIADSIREWGWTNPILIDERSVIIAGHGRLLAAQLLQLEEVPVLVATGWTEPQKRAYVLADNRLALDAGWDLGVLSAELGALKDVGFSLGLTGFGEAEVQKLLFDVGGNGDLAGADENLPGLEKRAVSRAGDLWILGEHRVLVGDSTDAAALARLMGEELAVCIHADPPYGMGKERDGVANDNLYREKLDRFQLAWWNATREHLTANGSLYVWGNAPDLWRLWYVGGLRDAGELVVRNEIVWAKGSAFGMRSSDAHSYPPESERCLFFMRGQQFLGNQNKDDYWDGWEPLRVWLVEQRDAMGWSTAEVNRLVKTAGMAGHWFGRSQFQPITREHYETLRTAAGGRAFAESFEELFGTRFRGMREAFDEHRDGRTYFDGAHDIMTDVWRFTRVHGEERFGHATPKPVAMVARALSSSVPKGGLFLAPFLGTGPELVAAEVLGRRCRAMELEAAYVDVAVRRWQEKSGAAAVLDGDGRTFEDVARERELAEAPAA